MPSETWLESGFKLVDDVLAWCNEFKIYLILDMHGAPGGQGYDSAISDGYYVLQLQTSSKTYSQKIIVE